MDNSLIIHDQELKLFICIENIVIEGTVSQNFDIGPSSFPVKFRKNFQRKITKSYPFFGYHFLLSHHFSELNISLDRVKIHLSFHI